MPSSGPSLPLASRFLEALGFEGEYPTLDVGTSCLKARSLFVNPMPPRTTEKSYRPRVSDRTMVDTASATVSLARVSENRPGVRICFPSFVDPLRTVLAVKGSQRRADWRALDGSGPF